MKKKMVPLFLLFPVIMNFAQGIPGPELDDYGPVLTGFSGGTAHSGLWQDQGGALVQHDDKALYAVYSLPLAQEKSNYVFRFKARADGEGWIGYGLHFFASGNERAGAYGYGSSFLVWLTRDEAYYKSYGTYLQLYRSFDDFSMIQLASISISENISNEIDTEIYYNAQLEILSISVNGDLKLFFPMKNQSIRGTSITLRSLGGSVLFQNLEVLQPVKQ